FSLEQGYALALESERKAACVFRVFQHGSDLLAELARRHRRAEARQKCAGFDIYRARIGIGARVAHAGAADHLLRHDRLEADSEILCSETPLAYRAMNQSMRLAPA